MQAKYTQYLCSFIIVLASIRGAFIYHLQLPSNLTYTLTGLLLVCFGLLSFRMMWINKTDPALILLDKAIKTNALLLSFYMPILMIGISFNQYIVTYFFAIFPIIFTLVKYDERLLNGIVYIITSVTTFGIIYFNNMGISGGIEAIQEAHEILREDFEYSRIGENLLPAGYQGSHHDAASILVMCGVFFFSKVTLSKRMTKYFTLTIYFVIFYAITLTGSTTNIIIMQLISICILLLLAKNNPLLIAFILLLLAIFASKFSDKFYFIDKLNYNQDTLEGGGIFNSLDINSILASFHTILIGFGYIFEVPMIHSEIAFLKILISFGLIPFLILMFICFSPVYYIHKFRKTGNIQARFLRNHITGISTANFIKTNRTYKLRLILTAMPVLAGTLTLLHYGSLFRITSIGLFCVFIALFFKEYLAINKLREIQFIALKLNAANK